MNKYRFLVRLQTNAAASFAEIIELDRDDPFQAIKDAIAIWVHSDKVGRQPTFITQSDRPTITLERIV